MRLNALTPFPDAGLLKPEVLEPEPQIHPTKTAAVSLTENRFQSASQLSPVHQVASVYSATVPVPIRFL